MVIGVRDGVRGIYLSIATVPSVSGYPSSRRLDTLSTFVRFLHLACDCVCDLRIPDSDCKLFADRVGGGLMTSTGHCVT